MKRESLNGFSMLELLVIMVVIALLVLVLVPSLKETKRKSQQIDCFNNLKQVGLAFRLWSPDSGDEYPMRRSTNYGGTFEVSGEVWQTFLSMTNELTVPGILRCPADNRSSVQSWAALANTNISYYIGLDAEESTPNVLLTGDRNLTNGRPLLNHVLAVSANEPVNWTEQLHQHRGNIGLSDGSVQRMEREALNRQISIGLADLAGGITVPPIRHRPPSVSLCRSSCGIFAA